MMTQQEAEKLNWRQKKTAVLGSFRSALKHGDMVRFTSLYVTMYTYGLAEFSLKLNEVNISIVKRWLEEAGYEASSQDAYIFIRPILDEGDVDGV